MSPTSVPSDQLGSRRKSAAPDGAAAERQLARWIAEGDDAALAELFDLVGPGLCSLAVGITNDRERADAAVEETFADLWEKRAWLGRLPALSPWLVERCRTWAIALRTGAAPAPAAPLQDRAGDVPLTRRLLRCPPALRGARVQAALDQVSPNERQALALAVGAAVAVHDIARELNASPDEVRALLRNGMHRVREELERTLRREMP